MWPRSDRRSEHRSFTPRPDGKLSAGHAHVLSRQAHARRPLSVERLLCVRANHGAVESCCAPARARRGGQARRAVLRYELYPALPGNEPTHPHARHAREENATLIRSIWKLPLLAAGGGRTGGRSLERAVEIDNIAEGCTAIHAGYAQLGHRRRRRSPTTAAASLPASTASLPEIGPTPDCFP